LGEGAKSQLLTPSPILPLSKGERASSFPLAKGEVSMGVKGRAIY
jgi:hypothetical protein